MAQPKTVKTARPRRGSSLEDRAAWRSTYEQTPYDQLPWFESGPSPPVRLAVEEGFLPPGGEVLDVGCGAGSNVLFLAASGYRAHGVDLSPGAVVAARARAADSHLNADIQEGDALALSFPTSGLDGMVDNGCFHTLPIARRADYAKEAYRVLRPGGSLVLSWVAREHTAMMGPRHRPSLQEVTSALESRFLFTRTGFRPSREPGAPSTYFAFLSRRSAPYPPPR
ncbi:MAG: class I SAM-dependent methyltransferase [Thermoplasmata archaeon]